MIVDLSYVEDGMFTSFYPNTEVGEQAYRELSEGTDGTGKILSIHLPVTLSQLKQAGYSVAPQSCEATSRHISDTELLNELLND